MPRDTFRLKSKNLFLTYPQCPLENLQPLFDFLKDFFGDNVLYLLVAHEEADETNPHSHFHCFVQLHNAKDIRSHAALDLVIGEQRWHGNYQQARKPRECYVYCTKEGRDKLETGEPNFKERRRQTEVYGEAMSASTKEEAREIIKSQAPRDYILFHGAVNGWLEATYKTERVYEPHFTEFPNLPDALLQWRLENLQVGILT